MLMRRKVDLNTKQKHILDVDKSAEIQNVSEIQRCKNTYNVNLRTDTNNLYSRYKNTTNTMMTMMMMVLSAKMSLNTVHRN